MLRSAGENWRPTPRVLATLHWAKENEKQEAEVCFENTDEYGNFQITIDRPQPQPFNRYLILVTGQAGLNDAAWKEEVTVQPGKETIVKLVAPEKSCLAVD